MAKGTDRGRVEVDGSPAGSNPGTGGQDNQPPEGVESVALTNPAKRDRQDEIASRLGLKRSAFPSLPAALKGAGLSYIALRIPGGKDALVELARLSDDDRMKAFVGGWDLLSPSDRERVPLEQVCSAANLSPSEFIAELARSAYRWNMDVSTLIAMMAQPVIIDKMTEFAMDRDGHKDREMLLKSSGFLPIPKGSRTTIHVSAQAAAVAATENGLPSFEEDVTNSVRVIRGEVEQGE